ncbi:hypothetical protein [Nannocystis punicea]|uniref:Lipoprotein n=1 Tax=Nannocystis punicea TaxID=2995304 RepID=A0ABY7H925_9BACT|nr:hypothetical protein [Nannocystis poenicansa]WAS95773.1 hypothetical protein O0S08_06385 [Nannocystis poenicansa]
MMIRATAKQSLSALLRPLALAVPVLACAAALPGCDDGVASRPADSEAWLIEQIEAVRDLTPEEQVQHVSAIADDFAVARSHLLRPGAPQLDLAGSDETPDSELLPAPTCEWDDGCIQWDISNGCVFQQLCYACSDGEWGCVIH